MRIPDGLYHEMLDARGRDRNQVTRLQIAKDFVLDEVLRRGEGWRSKVQSLKDWDGRGDIPALIDPCATKPSLGVEGGSVADLAGGSSPVLLTVLQCHRKR